MAGTHPNKFTREINMGITEAIAQGFRAIAEYFGWARQRSQEANREDVLKGQTAQNEVSQEDELAKAVARRDVEAIRKELSE